MKFKIELDLEQLLNNYQVSSDEIVTINELIQFIFDDAIWVADRMSPSSAKKIQKALDCYNEE